MDRRRLLLTSLAGALAAPFAVAAQQAPTRARLGLLLSGSAAQSPCAQRVLDSSFVPALRNLGWVEGKNLVLEVRYSEDQEEQLLKELVPRALRVAVLWNPRNPAPARNWKETQEASGSLGLKLLSVEVRTHDEVAPAFAAIARERPDALLVLLDSLVHDHRYEIVEFAAKNRLPALYAGPSFVEAGGLLVYTWDIHELWRRVAVYVDRILKGAKPADLPSRSPRSLTWSSTSRPPRPSASRSRRRCSRGRTRSSSDPTQKLDGRCLRAALVPDNAPRGAARPPLARLVVRRRPRPGRHGSSGLRRAAHPAYAARDWRATFYPVGIAHSIVSASAYEPTPWRAVQRAT